MLSIFNGRQRSLGEGEKRSVFLQVDVTMREHLQKFKGARLGAFMAISLHSNEDGWSFPSNNLLQKETGYNRTTISNAIADLCNITINGHRVLLAVTTKGTGGTFTNSWYLLFPSQAEVEMWAPYSPHLERPLAALVTSPKQSMPLPCSEKPYTEKPSMEKPCTENQHDNKNHHREPEPTIKGEPSIPPEDAEPKERDGWMDGSESAALLWDLGVRSETRIRSVMELSVETINQEWARVKESNNIKDQPAMLIHNLKKCLEREQSKPATPPAPAPLDPAADPRRPSWITPADWAAFPHEELRENLQGTWLENGTIKGAHDEVVKHLMRWWAYVLEPMLGRQEVAV